MYVSMKEKKNQYKHAIKFQWHVQVRDPLNV
jgi:hypothetical protein